MTIQRSVVARNAQADAFETAVGTAPVLRLYSGSVPANCAASLSGNTLLATGSLPSDWLAAATGGAKAKSGTWTLTGQSGAGSGTAATFYRLLSTDGTVVHEQGTVTVSGDGGDLTLNSNSISNGQTVTVDSYTFTVGNA